MRDIPNQTVEALSGLPHKQRNRLLSLRETVLQTASENPAIGPLEETLKWGEPAFLPSATKSGTTVRINRHNKSDDQYALYVHCQTDLIQRYKQLYDDILTFDGNRAVVFKVDEDIPTDAVKHCIAMALTYHLRSK